MFRASSAYLQEDTVVYMQHMVLSLSTRATVPYAACGGLSVHSLSENSSCVPTGHHELSYRVTVPYAACGGLSVHSLSENLSCVPTGHHELS